MEEKEEYNTVARHTSAKTGRYVCKLASYRGSLLHMKHILGESTQQTVDLIAAQQYHGSTTMPAIDTHEAHTRHSSKVVAPTCVTESSQAWEFENCSNVSVAP